MFAVGMLEEFHGRGGGRLSPPLERASGDAALHHPSVVDAFTPSPRDANTRRIIREALAACHDRVMLVLGKQATRHIPDSGDIDDAALEHASGTVHRLAQRLFERTQERYEAQQTLMKTMASVHSGAGLMAYPQPPTRGTVPAVADDGTATSMGAALAPGLSMPFDPVPVPVPAPAPAVADETTQRPASRPVTRYGRRRHRRRR